MRGKATVRAKIEGDAVTGTIALSSSLPPIYTAPGGTIAVNGSGAGALTINGGNAGRAFFAMQGTINISNLTIANGNASNGPSIPGQGSAPRLTASVTVSGSPASCAMRACAHHSNSAR